MENRKEQGVTSKVVRIVGIFYRRKVWFLVPFIGGGVLSLGVFVLLMQFYDSPLLPHGLKQWLEAENRKTILNSLETLQTEMDREKADIHHFERINKNELMPRLRAHLRVLGQLHVDLHEVKRATQEEERLNGANKDKTERLVAIWLNKKGVLTDLQKKYPRNHPKIIAFQREMKALEKEFSHGKNRLAAEIPKELSLNNLRNKEKELTERVRLYERYIENVPDKEKALAALVTKYSQTQQAYQALLQQKPTYIPDSIQMGLRGILLGFGLGLVLVFLREKMDRALHTDFELEHLLSLPVLASVLNYKEVPPEGVAKPSATWSSGSGDSIYGRKTVFLAKDHP